MDILKAQNAPFNEEDLQNDMERALGAFKLVKVTNQLMGDKPVIVRQTRLHKNSLQFRAGTIWYDVYPSDLITVE